jgi:hypothetical protein
MNFASLALYFLFKSFHKALALLIELYTSYSISIQDMILINA